MSGRRDESLLLDDMISAAERLIQLGQVATPGSFGATRDEADMMSWNLLVLGAATKRLRPPVRERFSDVDWRAIAGTRDRIAHNYEGILWWLVEEIITTQLPALLPRLIEIRDILREEFDAAV